MGRVVPAVGPRVVAGLVRCAVLVVLIGSFGCGDDSIDGPDDTSDADMATPVDARPTTDAPLAIDLGPIDCDTPGETQTVPCGFCGTRDRFCNADGEWEFTTECAGEGVCAPGTTRDEMCGSCGIRTVRCTDSCVWDDSATCMDEGGDCVPGERRVTAEGCPSGEYREVTCNASCTEEETLECGTKPDVDVAWLIYLRWRENSTESAPPTGTNATFSNARSRVINQLFQPMAEELPGPDFYTSITFYTDFVEPTMAFQGEGMEGPVVALSGLAPINDAANSLSTNRPEGVFDQGDWVGAGVEALYAVFGGSPHETSIHATGCPAGREEWMCWRPRSARIMVLISDVSQREGPVGTGEAALEGTGVDPAPATWSQAVAQFSYSRVVPYFAVYTGNVDKASIDLVGQHRQMAADLGLEPSRHLFVYDNAEDLENVVVPAIGQQVAELMGAM